MSGLVRQVDRFVLDYQASAVDLHTAMVNRDSEGSTDATLRHAGSQTLICYSIVFALKKIFDFFKPINDAVQAALSKAGVVPTMILTNLTVIIGLFSNTIMLVQESINLHRHRIFLEVLSVSKKEIDTTAVLKPLKKIASMSTAKLEKRVGKVFLEKSKLTKESILSIVDKIQNEDADALAHGKEIIKLIRSHTIKKVFTDIMGLLSPIISSVGVILSILGAPYVLPLLIFVISVAVLVLKAGVDKGIIERSIKSLEQRE